MLMLRGLRYNFHQLRRQTRGSAGAIASMCITLWFPVHRAIPYQSLGGVIISSSTADISSQRVISFMNKSIKLHVYAAVAAGLALCPIAAHAQTSPAAATRSDTAAADARGDRDEHHDYGWIGLAGLLGLIGLIRKNRHNHYDTTSTGSRRPDLTSTRG